MTGARSLAERSPSQNALTRERETDLGVSRVKHAQEQIIRECRAAGDVALRRVAPRCAALRRVAPRCAGARARKQKRVTRALCVLLLAISEPLLTHAKVVLIVPRQVRRSPAVPWRPPGHYKKSSYGGNDFHRHVVHYGRGNRYTKPFRPLPYGGDDFDGPEVMNHVHVPHGKDISHSISFGKGYIPYDNIKSNNLPFVHERYAGAYGRQPDYPSTSFTSAGQDYAVSGTAHSYENPQLDSYFSDMENTARNELRSSVKDSLNKYYGTRSIEKDLSLRNQQALSSIIEQNKDSLKGAEGLSSDAVPAAYAHAASAATSATIPVATGVQGAVVVPAGIPSATIAGNKDGIVLQDTVSMDEYQRKLEELTKAWPNVLATGVNFAAGGPISAPQQLHAGFPTTGLPGVGFGGSSGGIGNWLPSFAQSKQSYAVREDHGDPSTYDFRTMTSVQGTPYQHVSFSHEGATAGTGIVPGVHG
ncbi:hypothetical protein ALC62_08286 [Cyphomyrmex costatus]|uniref:Uncharacterized protein n=1 Tax=Cyphomyrmex costatus TaxID=456900 RepID=A0A195CK05_9HYME|nr:hypothetical protein ALC62_08286 [Cyphomyrmex costatus]